jgi:hypothetical protein
MSNRNYSRNLSAFRPSVYSTGTQSVQPYAPGWSQGAGYGSGYAGWFDYTPLGWAYNKYKGTDPYSEDAKTIKSAITSVAGAYNQYTSDAAAAKAAEEAERVRLEEEAQRMMIIKVSAFLVIGVGGYVAMSRYRKTGSVFGSSAGGTP